MESTIGFSGNVGARVIRTPNMAAWKVSNLSNVWGGLWRKALANALGMSHISGRLYARHLRHDGLVTDYGLVSTKLVTTAMCAFIVAQLQTETSAFGDFKYHDSGVGVTGANIADTDIETTDNESRATGSQEEGASTVIYKSIGTISYTGTLAITEHGLFNASSGVTLMDRHTFSAINVVNGDSIEFTYNLTVTAGG